MWKCGFETEKNCHVKNPWSWMMLLVPGSVFEMQTQADASLCYL